MLHNQNALSINICFCRGSQFSYANPYSEKYSGDTKSRGTQSLFGTKWYVHFFHAHCDAMNSEGKNSIRYYQGYHTLFCDKAQSWFRGHTNILFKRRDRKETTQLKATVIPPALKYMGEMLSPSIVGLVPCPHLPFIPQCLSSCQS